jgi:sugar phosphate permease
MNLARVPGQVLIGYASDRMEARSLILIMAAASTISVYAGWGAATNTGGLLGFSLAFGGFAGR